MVFYVCFFMFRNADTKGIIKHLKTPFFTHYFTLLLKTAYLINIYFIKNVQ